MLEAVKYKVFEPNNKDHLKAYHSIKYLGRQTNLRFVLEHPFLDVVHMMEHKIAKNVLNQEFGNELPLEY